MNGRTVMRASAVMAGMLLSKLNRITWFDCALLGITLGIALLGWAITKQEEV